MNTEKEARDGREKIKSSEQRERTFFFFLAGGVICDSQEKFITSQLISVVTPAINPLDRVTTTCAHTCIHISLCLVQPF